jgi:hypothetical protein
LQLPLPLYLIVIPEEPALSEVEWESALALAFAFEVSFFAGGGDPALAIAFPVVILRKQSAVSCHPLPHYPDEISFPFLPL